MNKKEIQRNLGLLMFLYGEEGILMVESPNVFSDTHSKLYAIYLGYV